MALVALACFACVYALGAYVSSRTPTRFDVEAAIVRGQAVPLAAFFTMLGRWYAIVPLGLAAMLYAGSRPRAATIAALLVSQLLSQGAANVVKAYFHRTRPDDWLVTHELGFSYPSGHATTAIAFYGALLALALLWHPQMRPLDYAVAACALACVFGIPWSRVALGAHYATDVIGGLLFGAGWLAMLLAVAAFAGMRIVRAV